VLTTVYDLWGTYYLGAPQWAPGPRLIAEVPIRSLDDYLFQHPEIAILQIKSYTQKVPVNEIENKDGTFKEPKSTVEKTRFVNRTMVEAMDEFLGHIPFFRELFPSFKSNVDQRAPYVFMFYALPFAKLALAEMDGFSRHLVEAFCYATNRTHGSTYDSARRLVEKGQVNQLTMPFLVRPGHVLVRPDGDRTTAFVVTSWPSSPIDNPPPVPELGHDGLKKRRHAWLVSAWRWRYDGSFYKQHQDLKLDLELEYDSEIVSVSALGYVPLKFAGDEIEQRLRARAQKFWKVRHRGFITYQGNSHDECFKVTCRGNFKRNSG
jgi:hypothetical protein